jgi:hypothetical protein
MKKHKKPVFPQNEYSDNEGQRGLTKLEYFTGLTMPGAWFYLTDCNKSQNYERAADFSAEFAKALITRLEAEHESA